MTEQAIRTIESLIMSVILAYGYIADVVMEKQYEEEVEFRITKQDAWDIDFNLLANHFKTMHGFVRTIANKNFMIVVFKIPQYTKEDVVPFL